MVPSGTPQSFSTSRAVLLVGDLPAVGQQVGQRPGVADAAAGVGLAGQRERRRARPAELAGQQVQGVEHVVQERALRPLVDAHRPQRHRRLRAGELERRRADLGRRDAQLRLDRLRRVLRQERLERGEIDGLLAVAEADVLVDESLVEPALVRRSPGPSR